MIAEGTGTAHAGVLAELHGLRRRLGQVEGSIVATTDGLVIAHDLGASPRRTASSRRAWPRWPRSASA